MDGLKEVVTTSVEAALKAVNTVDDSARPAAPQGANVNLRRYSPPSLGQAMKGLFGGFRQSQTFERDLTQAAHAVFGYGADEAKDNADPMIKEAGSAKNERTII